MKIINVDFSKRGKDIHYYKKMLRQDRVDDIDAKIERILTYQDLEARGRLLTKGYNKEKKKRHVKNEIVAFPHKEAL